MRPNTSYDTGRSGTAPGAPGQAALSDDLLHGADAIAEFLFGDPHQRRKVYYLTSEGRAQLPHFRLGTIICARKSTLLRWIEAAEARGPVSGQA